MTVGRIENHLDKQLLRLRGNKIIATKEQRFVKYNVTDNCYLYCAINVQSHQDIVGGSKPLIRFNLIQSNLIFFIK